MIKDSYNNTIDSIDALNKNITEFIDVNFFTYVEIEEDDTSGFVKIPELESFEIIDYSAWSLDLKLRFKNALHVSSFSDKDFVNIEMKEASLFKAVSDNH